MKSAVNPDASFSHHKLGPDKIFPNNLALPVLFYKGVLNLGDNAEEEVKEIFEGNGWTNTWSGTIFNYQHYHTKAHEALAVISGECMLIVGGDDGNIQKLFKGDVIVLPAGIAHKNLNSSEDFRCIGAYPQGQEYNKKLGKIEEKEEAIESIKNVPLPEHDPVFGEKGPVRELWKNEQNDTILQKERQF